MFECRTKLGADGRIVIPAQCRTAMHLNAGDEVVIQIDDGTAKLFSLRYAVEHAQKLVNQYTKGKKDLTQQLINMRREEAKHE